MRNLLFVLVLLFFVSCTKTLYVPVENTKIEYQDKIVESRDSIYLKDSIIIFVKGDTVFKDRYKTKLVYKERIDTFTYIKVDTISKPVIIEKEKKIGFVQQTINYISYFALIILIGILIFYFIRSKFLWYYIITILYYE